MVRCALLRGAAGMLLSLAPSSGPTARPGLQAALGRQWPRFFARLKSGPTAIRTQVAGFEDQQDIQTTL